MIIYYSVPEIWRVTDVIVIFSVWAIFCPFLLPPPPNSPKNQNEKKKMRGDIIVLHKCTKNHDHMLYLSEIDGCNCFFSFWAIFCPFTAQKIKI